MFATYGTSVCLAKTVFAPLERLRILSQVRNMANVASGDKLSGVTISNLSKVVREQGITSLWRGNNVNIYRNLMLIGLNVTVYDKIKNAYMPLEQSRYTGLDYYWRFFASAAMTCGVTAALVYPLDLIHTRISSDMSKKGQ